MTQAERAAVADSTGLPFSTVQKIAVGVTPDPRISTWSALAEYFGGVCAMPKVGASRTAKKAA